MLRSQGKICAIQQAQGAYLLDLVLLVLAPEADLGYSGLYGLQLDQGTPSRLTAGLLLLGGTLAERQAGQAWFRAWSRLIAERILGVAAPTDPLTPRRHVHPVVLDPLRATASTWQADCPALPAELK